jgi:toxin ParE1/3/4
VKLLRQRWPVRLAAAAEADFHAILSWTADHFGVARMHVYGETLTAALDALDAGPTAPGVNLAVGLPQGFFMLHMARRRRKGRHVIVFRVRRDSNEEHIEVLRILHDAMDIARHLPSS